MRFIFSLPFFTIPALNALKVDNYSVYLFDINISRFSFRYFSVFDEPGVVGTVCAILISYKAIEIKTFQGKVILLSGLLSFSLAFYIILIFNLIYYFNKKHIILFVLIFFTLSFLPEDNVIKISIIERLQFADGQLSGDNRTVKAFDNNYEYFLEEGGRDLWFGRGVLADQYDDIDNAGGSSYKYLVYRHGIVGVMLFIAFFTFVTLSIAPIKRGYFYLIVFILLAYQRINILLLYNIALFVGGLVKIAYDDIDLYNKKITIFDDWNY
ncbi:MAG: hypothetical protein JXB49_30335 [Bacteroidales bacterium]|nr:hypothetical protein [Bacteroidales bacterium]